MAEDLNYQLDFTGASKYTPMARLIRQLLPLSGPREAIIEAIVPGTSDSMSPHPPDGTLRNNKTWTFGIALLDDDSYGLRISRTQAVSGTMNNGFPNAWSLIPARESLGYSRTQATVEMEGMKPQAGDFAQQFIGQKCYVNCREEEYPAGSGAWSTTWDWITKAEYDDAKRHGGLSFRRPVNPKALKGETLRPNIAAQQAAQAAAMGATPMGQTYGQPGTQPAWQPPGQQTQQTQQQPPQQPPPAFVPPQGANGAPPPWQQAQVPPNVQGGFQQPMPPQAPPPPQQYQQPPQMPPQQMPQSGAAQQFMSGLPQQPPQMPPPSQGGPAPGPGATASPAAMSFLNAR